MLEQRKRVRNDLMNIHFCKLCRVRPRKIQQVIHDFRRPERLLRDLLEQLVPGIFRRDFLTQHLRITRDHGERRIDFVRNAGGEQTDRRQFFALHQLILEADAIGNVIDNDQRAARRSCFIHQRSRREIDDQAIPRLLVEMPGLIETL